MNDSGVITCHKDVGLVREVFDREALRKLGSGQMAIGHTRYSTFGTVNHTNAQPLVVRHIKGQMAIAPQRQPDQCGRAEKKLELGGAIFHTTNDSEIICFEIIHERLTQPSIEKAVEQAMYNLEGAYSLVIMSPEKLLAVRDRTGFRPLVMGRMKDGQIVFASETLHWMPWALPISVTLTQAKLWLLTVRAYDPCGHCQEKGHMCASNMCTLQEATVPLRA